MSFKVFAAACGAVLAATSVGAVSVGDQVTCTSQGGLSCDNATAVVGSGVEFSIGGGLKLADFSAGRLTFSSTTASSLGSTILSFSDLTNQITTASLLSNNGFSGFDASKIALNAGLLTLDLRGTSFNVGSNFVVALGGAVPEPASWAMMIAGFGFVGAAMRRRNVAISFA